MFYDRKVKYFDYIKDGERQLGAGFAKIEVRGDYCRLQLQISGLQGMDNLVRQVYLVSSVGEELLCQVELRGGRGTVLKELSAADLCNGLSYDALQAIRVPIAAGCELLCRIAEKEEAVEHNAEAVKDSARAMESSAETVRDSAESAESNLEGEADNTEAEERSADAEEGNTEAAESSAEAVRESAEVWESSTGAVEDSTEEMEQEVEFVGHNTEAVKYNASLDVEQTEETPPQNNAENDLRIMLASKWEQLSAIYPHINPFEDEREYLKLGPEDFVVLNNRSYQLAHNSFLLHGYYNYKHLILSRHEWRNEARYYIGVPGNFYEREKQVALMFGFESFECKQEPADNGTYGYYMIRVDL